MNIMPKTPTYEAPPARSSAAFSGGNIVYTEDVGGSIPSSPTNFSMVYVEITNFALGSLNLTWYDFDTNRAGKVLATPIQP